MEVSRTQVAQVSGLRRPCSRRDQQSRDFVRLHCCSRLLLRKTLEMLAESCWENCGCPSMLLIFCGKQALGWHSKRSIPPNHFCVMGCSRRAGWRRGQRDSRRTPNYRVRGHACGPSYIVLFMAGGSRHGNCVIG